MINCNLNCEPGFIVIGIYDHDYFSITVESNDKYFISIVTITMIETFNECHSMVQCFNVMHGSHMEKVSKLQFVWYNR